MKRFHFKIIFSFLVLLIIFLSCMFPFISNSVQRIVINSMNERAAELIETVQVAQDEDGLIQMLKEQSPLLFYHVGLMNEQGTLLYDSHMKRMKDMVFLNDHIPPEVISALNEGNGYTEEYSPLFGKTLTYFAKCFTFEGKKYALRLAFPHEYIYELKRNFKIGFLLFSSFILILFSAIIGIILYHIMKPVQQIIRAITPYQEGKTASIPEIRIRSYLPDEFFHLGETLNSLSHRIQNQIETLTHERNEKDAILQSLAEGVLAVDRDLKIVYANSMAISILELPRECEGTTLSIEKHLMCCTLLGTCLEEERFVNDELEITSDGKKLYLNVIASPLKKQGGAILVLQDKSIQYKILEMRKDFIANASHELKTPITVIRGFAETLSDNPNLPKETMLDITDKITRSCHKMTKIIKNLLTLADIENLPHFRLQECCLKELAETCKKTTLARHPFVKIEIEAKKDTSFVIEGDVELLEVAIMNLLDNAVKYSEMSAEIRIMLTRSDESVMLSVQDKGIGIPEQDLEHIFQRFYTVNKAQSKKLGGSGLGLSIVETIALKHYGTVSVLSEIGVGSTFMLKFPLNLKEKLQPILSEEKNYA